MVTLEQAIQITVERSITDPAAQFNCDFRSVEAMTMACDPTGRGVFGAANNRAAVRLYATTGEFRATPEGIEAELAELAAAGFAMPRCGCRVGSCNVPAAVRDPRENTEVRLTGQRAPLGVPLETKTV